MSDEVRQRLLVAAVLIPVTVLVVWVGGTLFLAGVVLLAGVASGEFVGLLRGAGRPVLPAAVVAGSVAFPIAVAALGPGAAWQLAAGILPLAGAWALVRVPMHDGPVTAAAYSGFGVLYIGGLLGFTILLRGEHAADRLGATLVFFLPVLVTWVADTAAFFGGRRWGRRALAATISPNKTVEGAVASVVAGPVTAVLYEAALLAPVGGFRLGVARAALIGLGVGLAAIGGDLVESALKRECGAKDASDLLPGHGGLLDRMDSLLWTVPVAHLLLLMLGRP